MIKSRLIWIVFCMFSAQIACAGVYHRVDEGGNVYFGDQPQDSGIDLSRQPAEPISRPRQADEQGYPKSIILGVRGLLEKEKFAELNRKLAHFQSAFESDVSAEDELFTAYDAFKINSPSSENLFNAWIRATPGMYQPYLARARYYASMGWHARGPKWASETKQAQFRKMNAYFDKARKDIGRVLELNSKTILPYYMLIEIGKAHDGGEALPGSLSASNPWLEALMGAAGVTRTVTDTEKALRAGLRISPGSFYLRTIYLRALTPRWGGSFAKMQAFVDESLGYVSQNPKLKLLSGYTYMEAGDIQSLNDKYSEADKLYTKALAYGDNPSALLDRGKNSYRREEFASALKDINLAIELYSEDGKYYYWRSKVYGRQGKYIKASFDIKRASMLTPYDDSISELRTWLVNKLLNLGYASSDKRDYKKAIEYLDAALHVDPDEAEIYYWRGRALIGQNKRGLALGDLKKAIALNPNEFGYYQLVDWLLAKHQKWDDIIRYWDQYIRLNPDDSRAYVERGGTYLHKGDIRAAVKNAKIAADMGNPDGKAAYEKFKGRVQ